jgi:hypothetical protein
MNARRPVSTARRLVRCPDLCDQRIIFLSTPRRSPLRPRVIAAGGDTQQPAHGGNREGGLILAHEPEPFDGIAFVSRANQAAGFERISLSSLSWRLSRRSWVSSSRSAVVSSLPPRPASHSAWPTQFLIDWPSVQTPAPVPPASARRGPVRPSGDGIQVCRVVSSSPSWTP